MKTPTTQEKNVAYLLHEIVDAIRKINEGKKLEKLDVYILHQNIDILLKS